MIFNVCLFFLVNIFSYTIINAIPHARYRRQSNPHKKDGLPYAGWAGGSSNPSGAIPGAYYGTGVDPNYGILGPHTNAIHDSVNVIHYNNDYTSNVGYSSNGNQQQQYYLYNNINRRQNPYFNNYYNRPYNRYPPGSQGWYATGGNYWYNKGQSLIPHAWLLTISSLISINYI